MPTIDLEIHGSEMRASCLADFVEVLTLRNAAPSEEDLADLIRDRGWMRQLDERLRGPGAEREENGHPHDLSRERAAAVLGVIEHRQALLGERYPFVFGDGRRLEQMHDGAAYRWHLYLSMAHGLDLAEVPKPAHEFERSVSNRLTTAGLPTATVGTAAGRETFSEKIATLAAIFPVLVPTLNDALFSRFQKDGGIDTFGMFYCGVDRRAAQWAFIGQSTVGRSNDWTQKIYEPIPDFWADVFGKRILPIPFFATPHHIANPYFDQLAYHGRCLLDRIRLTNWTQEVPASLDDYHNALIAIDLE